MIPQRIFEKLRCPYCEKEIKEWFDQKTQSKMHMDIFCPECKTEYNVLNGIPSLIIGDPEDVDWNTWKLDEINMSGSSYYKRAKGEIPEKDCSRSFAHFMLNNKLYNPGDEILDLGCASGHYLKSFREHLDKDVLYTGIDSHMDFLQWGAIIFGVNEKANFVNCDGMNLPFKDNSFDIGIVQLFHFFYDVMEALKETCRVCKKYVIWRTPVSHIANYTVKIFLDKTFAELGNITVDTKSHKYDIYNIFTPKYIEGMIESLGYKLVKWEKDTDFGEFDNTSLPEFAKQPATKVVSGLQINGALNLDWTYFVIDCSGNNV